MRHMSDNYVFPAYAGMILMGQATSRTAISVPRICGDDPPDGEGAVKS